MVGKQNNQARQNAFRHSFCIPSRPNVLPPNREELFSSPHTRPIRPSRPATLLPKSLQLLSLLLSLRATVSSSIILIRQPHFAADVDEKPGNHAFVLLDGFILVWSYGLEVRGHGWCGDWFVFVWDVQHGGVLDRDLFLEVYQLWL